MQTSAPIGPPEEGTDGSGRVVNRLLDYLPRGNTLDEGSWRRRHKLLQWVLLLHMPAMAALGLLLGNTPLVVGYTLIAPAGFLVLGHVLHNRRLASSCITGGLVFSSAGLVVLTSGSIEAHFHFFIIIGFIALYQDWVPFLWNVGFTFLSHGIGTIWLGSLIFAHPAGQANPWLWSFIHGIAVLFACVGMVIFWRITEDEQTEKEALGRRLITADAEIGRRRFTSEMLVNLARRNQSMLYRQLDIINQLEERERDPDALSHLFTLDHLATRVRRNAESLLVLAGEQPPRTWSAPVPLRDVVRAAIAETEDLDRVVFAIDEHVSVSGGAVADLTHLIAELTENAVRFSPPDTAVTIRARPDRRDDGGFLMTIEDWGVGMPPDDLAAANELLATPREVDLAVAQRLGFHVVARLAARHGISVSLGNTPGTGVTAVLALPAALFAATPADAVPLDAGQTEARPYVTGEVHRREMRAEPSFPSTGWVEPVSTTGAVRNGNGHLNGHVNGNGHTNGNGHANGNGHLNGNGNGHPRWSEPAEAAAEPNRHGLDGAPEGGWRGWWNPESVATAASRHSDREPVGAGGADGHDSAGGDDRPQRWQPSPTPRDRQAPAAAGAPADTDPGIPSPRPAGEAVGGTENGTGDENGGKPQLRRRVPQAHLAPELRQPAGEEPSGALGPDGAAASALSRYQASRQAAQAVVDESGPAGGMGR